ncbi:hypothetical protein ACLPJK_26130 [Pseudomonas aeruginosa]|uniref:hypothetical protein n=1 Tax=Pseudomonas aeruginosa TaxID=287 RepID=UPI003D2B236A
MGILDDTDRSVLFDLTELFDYLRGELVEELGPAAWYSSYSVIITIALDGIFHGNHTGSRLQLANRLHNKMMMSWEASERISKQTFRILKRVVGIKSQSEIERNPCEYRYNSQTQCIMVTPVRLLNKQTLSRAQLEDIERRLYHRHYISEDLLDEYYRQRRF